MLQISYIVKQYCKFISEKVIPPLIVGGSFAKVYNARVLEILSSKSIGITGLLDIDNIIRKWHGVCQCHSVTNTNIVLGMQVGSQIIMLHLLDFVSAPASVSIDIPLILYFT